MIRISSLMTTPTTLSKRLVIIYLQQMLKILLIVQQVGVIFKTFNNRIGGAWMKDISNDDFDEECGCGPFPTLRAANEGLYESTCKIKSCFEHP